MQLGLLNREQMSGFLAEAFDALIGQIQGGWNREHRKNGLHHQVTADGHVSVGTRLLLKGYVTEPATSLTSLDSDKWSVDLTSASVIRLEPSAALDLTGIPIFDAFTRGQLLLLHNISAYDITCRYESTRSPEFHRLLTPDQLDMVIPNTGGSALAWYDEASLRWRLLPFQAGILVGSNTGDQFLFNTIAVAGQSNIVADSLTDTLTVASGSVAVILTTNAAADTLTIDVLPFIGDSGAGGAEGLVPAPATGDAAAGKYLKADGTWAVPPGSGGGGGGPKCAAYVFSAGGTDAAVLIGTNPADATTYIFGDRLGFAAATTPETLRITMPRAGTAKASYGLFIVLGTLGSAGSSTVTLHNRTAGTSEVISSSAACTASTNRYNNTAMTLAFSAGDELDISWVTPTWATNPTTVVCRVDLYVEFSGTSGSGTVLNHICDGRLTTETGVPVSTADRTSQSTLYFTPYQGNQVALYDGSAWVYYTLTEKSLALSGLTSGKNYDVFLYPSGSAPALELSAAWASDTARTDAITLQDGVYVKSGATTRRLVGTIRTTATTTTEDSKNKRFVWNVQHRVRRVLYKTEASNWAYTTGAYRQANANAANQIEFVVGLQEDDVRAEVATAFYSATGNLPVRVGIGDNSTTVSSATIKAATGTFATTKCHGYCSYVAVPRLGYSAWVWLEWGGTGVTAYGGADTDGVIGGISGEMFN